MTEKLLSTTHRCYVGKARLRAAVQAFESPSNSDDTAGAPKVHVSFSPYMIDVRTQPNGEDYQAYTERRWGGDGWTASMKRCQTYSSFLSVLFCLF